MDIFRRQPEEVLIPENASVSSWLSLDVMIRKGIFTPYFFQMRGSSLRENGKESCLKQALRGTSPWGRQIRAWSPVRLPREMRQLSLF
jgi:hypothetical protein